MIIIPIVAGIFLRVFQIWNNYFFSGELGKELLYVLQLIQNHHFPLVGLATSHEWLTYGPIYYWILIPLVNIFGWSPFILFWLALFVSMVGILITYFVFKEIVCKKFALILSFFISFSPLWIWATRLSKLHTFFFILMPLTIYFLYKVWEGKSKFMFWLGLTFGAFFSFHYSQMPIFIVLALAFYLKREKLRVKDYLLFVLGLVVPNVTILIYDAQSGFTMLKNLFLWIPYRIAGFSGITSKNNLTLESGKNTLLSFNEFFGRNLFTDSRFWFIGSAIFLILFVSFFIKNRKKITKNFLVFYLISSTIVQCFSLLIHTSPPIHYFFPIFLNFGIFFSYYADNNWQNRWTRILATSIFILMFVTELFTYKTEHLNDSDYTPLSYQKRVADEIVQSANGQPFGLIRLGPYDYFPENYSQNYQFLILHKGGKIDQSSSIKYIIYDIGDVYVQKIETNE